MVGDIWVSLCMCGDNWTYYEENGGSEVSEAGGLKIYFGSLFSSHDTICSIS